MQITSSKVVNGRVVVEADLPEGAEVALIAFDGEENFEVGPELEEILIESIAQAERAPRFRPRIFSASFAVANDRVSLC